MDDPTDGLRWAFYLTLSGLWDSFLPSPTSQAPYIAFEFLKHWPSPLESLIIFPFTWGFSNRALEQLTKQRSAKAITWGMLSTTCYLPRTAPD
ncbi:hypothetical protein FOBRF1_002861 [Fusarium oxysporum]